MKKALRVALIPFSFLLLMPFATAVRGPHQPAPLPSPVVPNWFESRSYGGHKIKMLRIGAELRAARFDLITNAKKSIYLATYAFENEPNNARYVYELCKKVKEGVDVRLLTCHYGSPHSQPILDKMRSCGVKVIVTGAPLKDYVYAVHEKILVADGQRVVIGGSGYARGYEGATRATWYDMDFQVDGPAACYFNQKFKSNWIKTARAGLDYDALHDSQWRNATGDEYYQMRPQFWGMRADEREAVLNNKYGINSFVDCNASSFDYSQGSRALPVLANPYFSSERPILDAHLNAIWAAQHSKKKEIKLYAPYFVPNEAFANWLAWAAKSGVKVSVITNTIRSNDEKDLKANLVMASMSKRIEPLLKAGVKVYFWPHSSTVHRKGGVFGGKLALVGSDNLDNRAQDYSSESILYTDDKEIVRQINEDFDRDMKESIPITPEMNEQNKNILKWYEKPLQAPLENIL